MTTTDPRPAVDDTSSATPPSHSGDGAAPPPDAAAEAQTTAASGGGRSSLRTFESLSHPGYRWYFLSMLGQMASLNMQQLVRGFLVFELTGSYAALGTMYLVNSVPGLALSTMGGVLADRVRHKKYVVQAGQLLNGANAFVIALLLVADLLRFEHLLVAAIVHGTVMSLMMPARQAMLPEVIGLDRLTNAVALNSAGMNATRLLAPSIGGFLIAVLGSHWVYFSITGLYLYASALLTLVPTESVLVRDEVDEAGGTDSAPRERGRGGLTDLVDGFRYIATDVTMRLLLGVAIIFAVLSMPYLFLLPGFVAGVLEEGPGKLGLLMTLPGIGSLTGSLIVASMRPAGRGRLFLLSGILLGVALIAFSISTAFWVTAAIMLAVGVGDAGRQSLSMVLVQNYVRDEYRGRVMSVYMMQRSIATFGTFFVGLAASIVGVQLAIGAISGVLVAVAAGLLLFLPALRDLD